MARSAASVNSGARPSDMMTSPATRSPGPPVAPTWVSSATPTSATTIPPSIATAGRIRAASGGVSCEPTTNATAPGTLQSPASSGE